MSDDKIRLLICHTCGSIEELPDYQGPPERDDTLNYRVSFHKFGSGDAHFGIMGTVKADDWKNQAYKDAIADEIYKKMTKPGSGEGLGNEFYDIKSNFQQDAFACFKSFGRPKDPSFCDYHKENKRLYPDTKGMRKEEGLDTKTMPSTFLCDFCPVQSIVQTRKNKANKMYN